MLATIEVATLVLRQASFVLRASLRLRTKPALRRQQGKSGSGRSCGRRGDEVRELVEVLECRARFYDDGNRDRAGDRRHALKAQRQAGHHAGAGFAGRRSVGGRFVGSGFGVMARHVVRRPGRRRRLGRALHALHGGRIERRHAHPDDQKDRKHSSDEGWHVHMGTLSHRSRLAKPLNRDKTSQFRQRVKPSPRPEPPVCRNSIHFR
jgi:hypothetical protein